MATQAADVRTDRLVVLLSKSEKSALTARARAADMTVSDYIRTAAERFNGDEELSEDFQAEVLDQIEQIKARMQATSDDLDAYMATRREPDRAAIRREVFEELRHAKVDWDEVRSVLDLNH